MRYANGRTHARVIHNLRRFVAEGKPAPSVADICQASDLGRDTVLKVPARARVQGYALEPIRGHWCWFEDVRAGWKQTFGWELPCA